jgi:PilZ domain
MQDRRQFPRFTVTCRVWFDGVRFGIGQVYNLSLGGCAMKSQPPVEPGSVLRLLIYFSHEADPLIIDGGIVRWMDRDRFGVEFLMMAGSHLERLRTYLRQVER